MIYELINSPESNIKIIKDEDGDIVNCKDVQLTLTTDCSADKLLLILENISELKLDNIIIAIQKAGYHCARAYNAPKHKTIYIDILTLKFITK